MGDTKEQKDEARPRGGLGKKLLISLGSLVFFTLLAEGGARVGTWVLNDFNPYYLLRGFRSWTDDEGAGHGDRRKGYDKFFPSRVMKYGTPEPAHINNHGFRGPDFEAAKPPGTFRIICLGGSSTYGYTNPDDGTYPHLLQKLFDEKGPLDGLGDGLEGVRVEVINVGIPHATSSNVRAMVEAELFDYEPDLFTFYSAYNDAVVPMAESGVQNLSRTLDEYSAAYAAVRTLVNKMQWAALEHRWTQYEGSMPRETVELQVRLHEDVYRDNLTTIFDLAAERGVQVVAVRQAISMWFEAEKRGIPGGREPYMVEHDKIAARLASEGGIHGFESTMLVHKALMDLLLAEAAQRDLPLVDNVELVDERLESLVSKVHLDVRANARLAKALYETILPLIPVP